MMIGLLTAGIVAILAGALAVAYGLMLELSFGNTLILAGAFGICGGMIVLAQAAVVRELRHLGRKLSKAVASDALAGAGLAEGGLALPRDLAAEREASAPSWREEGASRDRMRQEPAPPVAPPPELSEPVPPPSRRRNLMFSSSRRKDREQPQQEGEPAADDQAELPETAGATPAGFEDAWPRPERTLRPSEMLAQRRAARAALAEGKAPQPPSLPPKLDEEPPSGVSVIKSGVVDGMAYSLYSDGSIEAQMPEGMMRFASIDELRAHLDQR